MADKLVHRAQQSPASDDLLERFTRFNLHFGRYLRDAFGVLVIAAALVIVLGLLKLTGGSVLTPLSDQLARWFGWGSYVLLAGLVLGGVALIRRSGGRMSWGRLLALELAVLFTLSILSLVNGTSLARAESGMDGGRIGWGLAYLSIQRLGTSGGRALLVGAWLLSLATGLGVWRWIEVWLLKLAGETSAPQGTPAMVKQPEPAVKPETPRTPAKKSSAKIPPEFRTSLTAPEKKTTKPAKPVLREEGLPPLNILLAEQSIRPDERTINQTAGMIMKTLSEFGIPATVIGYRMGPAVTQFAVQPGFIKKPGSSEDDDAQQMKVRVAQIANLQKDLA